MMNFSFHLNECKNKQSHGSLNKQSKHTVIGVHPCCYLPDIVDSFFFCFRETDMCITLSNDNNLEEM